MTTDQIIQHMRRGAALWIEHNGLALLHVNGAGCAVEVHAGEARAASRAVPYAPCNDPRGDLFAYTPADLAAYRAARLA